MVGLQSACVIMDIEAMDTIVQVRKKHNYRFKHTRPQLCPLVTRRFLYLTDFAKPYTDPKMATSSMLIELVGCITKVFYGTKQLLIVQVQCGVAKTFCTEKWFSCTSSSSRINAHHKSKRSENLVLKSNSERITGAWFLRNGRLKCRELPTSHKILVNWIVFENWFLEQHPTYRNDIHTGYRGLHALLPYRVLLFVLMVWCQVL